MRHPTDELHTTYSVVARDPDSGHFGVAVQTHQMTVGNFVPWLAAGAGAVATQALGNIRFGPLGLALLRQGLPAQKVVDALVATDDGAHQRQLAVVDAEGRVAAWTGDGCIEYAGHETGDGFSVQANMMTRPTVVAAMSAAYRAASGDLAERMLAAMQAAQLEDGDIRGMQSAALRVVKGDPPAYKDPAEWRPVYDLRVDEADDPLTELGRLVRLRHAQLIDSQGHQAMEGGDHGRALELWAQARQLAPELEEMGYWQALNLADVPADVPAAASLMNEVLAADPRRQHWIDLIGRIERAGLFERAGAGTELVAALNPDV